MTWYLLRAPVLYKGENGGVMKYHLHCRSEGKASLFDVSHMIRQIQRHWQDRVAFGKRLLLVTLPVWLRARDV